MDEFDSICQKFESAWRTGEPVAIDAFIDQIGPDAQAEALCELLQIELWWRRDEADPPCLDEYLQRFPLFPDAVRSAFHEFEMGASCPRPSAPVSCKRQFDDAATDLVSSKPVMSEARFRIIDQLGEGAFGAVWKAYDSQLGRMVALKSPHQSRLDGEFRERFLRESRAAARLHHDGIVSVYDVCESESDQPIIVSQFVDGTSLAELQKQRGLFTCKEAADMCADLADALLHAHLEGIVHRDLKPANILIDAGGKAYVTDFGLAKDIQNDVSVTHEGDVLGTVAYMPPEQASGFGNQVDGRGDIYSIGVILYEMVTGERPFRGTMQAVLQQVIHDAPPSPQKLNTSVTKDLQTIILKCMEKQPEHRYQNAADLRDDLLRYVNNKPIIARPPSLIERFAKWYPWHATEMLGTYFIVAPLTWVFFMLGGMLEPPAAEGYQLSSLIFLPWAIAWILVGAMIIKRGFWFEIMNVPLLLAFMYLPVWLSDKPQSIALICLISFFGLILQFGAFLSRRLRIAQVNLGDLTSRLSSGGSNSSE